MTPESTPAPATEDPGTEPPPPACVMCFNASDPSGAGGMAGDVATIAAMGAHALPVITSIVQPASVTSSRIVRACSATTSASISC